MSRGLGKLQVEIKDVLARAAKHQMGALRFADIRAVLVINRGGKTPDDVLDPFEERSAKRALKGLVDRGDVLIVGGKGGQLDPFRYVTVEAVTGKRDTGLAKLTWKRTLRLAAVAQARGIPKMP